MCLLRGGPSTESLIDSQQPDPGKARRIFRREESLPAAGSEKRRAIFREGCQGQAAQQRTGIRRIDRGAEGAFCRRWNVRSDLSARWPLIMALQFAGQVSRRVFSGGRPALRVRMFILFTGGPVFMSIKLAYAGIV